jgi:hypothetical protein
MTSDSLRVGQRVLCIDGDFSDASRELCPHVPLNGEIYTVRSVRAVGGDSPADTMTFITLMEVHNAVLPNASREPSFLASRFVAISLDATSDHKSAAATVSRTDDSGASRRHSSGRARLKHGLYVCGWAMMLVGYFMPGNVDYSFMPLGVGQMVFNSMSAVGLLLAMGGAFLRD